MEQEAIGQQQINKTCVTLHMQIMGSLPCNCCLTGNHGRPFAGHHLILLLFGLRSAVSQIDMQSQLLGIIYLSSLSNLAIGDSQQDPSLGISEISDYICR